MSEHGQEGAWKHLFLSHHVAPSLGPAFLIRESENVVAPGESSESETRSAAERSPERSRRDAPVEVLRNAQETVQDSDA